MLRRMAKYVVVAITVSALAAYLIYYSLLAIGVRDAKEHVKDILLSNRGFHEYIQRVMHPAFFDAMQKGEIAPDFYRPELLSSTYIVRTQHEFYNKIRESGGMHPVYYKLAAINPRNPVNKADEREHKLIEHFNKDRSVRESEEIVSVGGHKYIYYAVPFLQNEKRCMRCHGDPADAPPGLRAIYPGDGGFYEQLGEIRAIESIRMPIDERVNLALVFTGGASSGVFALLMLTLISLRLGRRVQEKTRDLEEEFRTRKQTEAEVIEQSNLLNTFIDHSPLPIIGLDLEGRVSLWNSAAFGLFGWTQAELFEETIPVIPNEGRLAFNQMLTSALESRMSQTGEISACRKDGSRLTVNVAISCLHDVSGAPFGFMTIYEDITEKKSAMETISRSLREKEVLLQEVHHRVKNNMAVISSLLKMQAMLVDDERTLAALKESQSRIRSMALVHEKLYQSKDFTNIDVKEYVLSLARSIRETYETGPRVDLSLDVDDISLTIDTLVPCGLIINELLSNAYKYAFAGREGEAMKIALSLKKQKGGGLVLNISDNGAGLPESFDIEKPTGLGLKLVNALTAQLDGKLEARSNGGAHFTVSFEV